MSDTVLLPSIVTIFALSIFVILFCDKLRLPTIVGFLLTGIICGPHGLKLVSDTEDVRNLAEIGVVLLLFKIGMKMTLSKIYEFKRFFLISGTFQVIATVLAGFLIAKYLDRPTDEAIFFGFLISLSSTAIILKLLEDRGETSSPHGKAMLGILIFQDIAAVLMMLIVPQLTKGMEEGLSSVFIWDIAQGLLILFAVFYSASKVIPKLLYLIARTRKKELFLLSILTICFGVAWLAFSLGLSLALGAFLAGMIIADSEYSTEAIGGLIPYQEVFTSFFFVSVGMLFNVEFVFHELINTVLMAMGILLMKASITTFVVILTGMPLRTSLLAGIGLAQIGEFSFVLMRYGSDAGIGTSYHYQLFLAVSVISMALTPALIFLAPYFANAILRLPLPKALKVGFSPLKISKTHEAKRDHLILVGYGFVGNHLSYIAKDIAIPYVVLEMNADTVLREKKKGIPIHFGDATHDVVLEHVNIENAKMIAIAINDPIAAHRIVGHARRLNPGISILVRCRTFAQMDPLFQAGANHVIPEEFGTTTEFLNLLFDKFQTPEELVERSVNLLRDEGYELIRHHFYKKSEKTDL